MMTLTRDLMGLITKDYSAAASERAEISLPALNPSVVKWPSHIPKLRVPRGRPVLVKRLSDSMRNLRCSESLFYSRRGVQDCVQPERRTACHTERDTSLFSECTGFSQGTYRYMCNSSSAIGTRFVYPSAPGHPISAAARE